MPAAAADGDGRCVLTPYAAFIKSPSLVLPSFAGSKTALWALDRINEHCTDKF